MNTNLLCWILGTIIMAASLLLFLYFLNRRKVLERFARSHHLPFKAELQNKLQKILDESFSLAEKNLIRSFDQLSHIISGDSTCLFRAVEYLDFNPHEYSYTTHYQRIIVLFKISQKYDEFFLIDKSMQITPRVEGEATPSPKIKELFKECLKPSDTLLHSLSVTFSNGYGLIYIEPSLESGESLRDLSNLYNIADKLSKKLNNGAEKS